MTNNHTPHPSKTAVITGGSRGIGYAAALLFLERGWRVITCSRTPVSDEYENYQEAVYHIPADLSDQTGLENFVEKTKELLKEDTLHGLVNNAGMSPKAQNKERLGCLNGDLEAWRQVLELNFYAPLRLSRAFASNLHKGQGAIVNITSIAGHAIHPFASSAYAISKAALSALSREMANEFAALNVRVNAVAPGEIQTEMIQPEYEALIPRIPLERMGSPRDVASTIYYLCSEDSGYITGSEIWVTGGQHLL